ncbi:hypothetical protein D9613_002328 [Agrocybe pediades]|uniref:Uncharacterized protein n=1 Tax=Agrocybe pediades TaxID=84607 RepID=A0A8H4R6J2_9AGAR|nr:hypothetical protein D9613_002328 [Agrocybe pediades]
MTNSDQALCHVFRIDLRLLRTHIQHPPHAPYRFYAIGGVLVFPAFFQIERSLCLIFRVARIGLSDNEQRERSRRLTGIYGYISLFIPVFPSFFPITTTTTATLLLQCHPPTTNRPSLKGDDVPSVGPSSILRGNIIAEKRRCDARRSTDDSSTHISTSSMIGCDKHIGSFGV